MNAPTSVEALRTRAIVPSSELNIEPGFGSLAGFELMQRQAKMFSSSTLVPVSYRSVVEKLDYKGNVVSSKENPSALANCMIALNISNRMKADPLAVMQNLYIVEGRPSWSSQWIIASINNCGRFSPLRFEITDLGEKTCDYTTYSWDNTANAKVPKTVKVKVHNFKCVAWVIEKGSVDEHGKPVKLSSPAVTIEMAVNEGWYSKNGSKWQTMPDMMLRYRTASFFGKLYAPELLMGIPATDEVEDITPVKSMAEGADGIYAPVETPVSETVESLRKTTKAKADKQDEATDVNVKAEGEQTQAAATATAEPAATTATTAEATPAAAAKQATKASVADDSAMFGNTD